MKDIKKVEIYHNDKKVKTVKIDYKDIDKFCDDYKKKHKNIDCRFRIELMCIKF